MLSITRIHRCYLYRNRTDMRKGVDSLCGLIRNELGKDPLGGELFVFFNRTHTQIKLLLWEQDGFSLYQKKLERGTYELPENNELHHSISSDHLNLILQGISLKSVRHRTRYRHGENNLSVVQKVL
jgi:transposase